MSGGSALGDLVQALTALVGTTGSARDATMEAESEAGKAMEAAQAYGRDSDVIETEALKSAAGEQAAVLANLTKTAEELLQRAAALQGTATNVSAGSTSGGAGVIAPAQAMSAGRHRRGRGRHRLAKAKQSGQKLRMPSTAALGFGVSSAATASAATAHVFPPAVQTGINAAISAGGSAVAMKSWLESRKERRANRSDS